jgi:mRNA-degrading endonuclease RelE of RelBE toxin-antitoxin system
MFKIAWKQKAFKQLHKIKNQQDREDIYNAVGTLSNWPDCTNIKALVNHDSQYRLRIGRYRILFNVDTTIKIIEINKVTKRNEQTY